MSRTTTQRDDCGRRRNGKPVAHPREREAIEDGYAEYMENPYGSQEADATS